MLSLAPFAGMVGVFGLLASQFKWDDRGRLFTSDLDCSPGNAFQLSVFKKFGSSVHHASSSPSERFLLLAVFRCFTFHLFVEYVSLALHSILGGSLASFLVVEESNNHFWFSVASKRVGFMMLALMHFISETFDVYFHLWRKDRPN